MKTTMALFVLSVVFAAPAAAQTGAGAGMYVGGGLVWGSGDIEDVSFGSQAATLNGAGIAGFGGYRIRAGRLAVGPEFGFSVSFAEGTDGLFLAPVSQGLSFDLRGRVGVSAGRIEPYAAIGWVRVRFEADHEGAGAADDLAKSSIRALTVAAGADWSLDHRSFVRGELGWIRQTEGRFAFYGGSDAHTYRAGGIRLLFAYARIF